MARGDVRNVAVGAEVAADGGCMQVAALGMSSSVIMTGMVAGNHSRPKQMRRGCEKRQASGTKSSLVAAVGWRYGRKWMQAISQESCSLSGAKVMLQGF